MAEGMAAGPKAGYSDDEIEEIQGQLEGSGAEGQAGTQVAEGPPGAPGGA